MPNGRWIIECKFSKGWEIHMEFDTQDEAMEEFEALMESPSYNVDPMRLTYIPAQEV